MRKVFWCCVAAGAAVCCAFWAAAYVSQNPDSPVGRCALAACKVGARAGGVSVAAAQASHAGTAESDELIPPDPVPVDEPPVPTPGATIPPAVEALFTTPPIIIHDEEDLNPSAGPVARTEAPGAAPRVDVESTHPAMIDAVASSADVPTEDVAEPQHFAGAPVMPYCADDAGPAPVMPYCADDDPAPAAPARGEDGRKVSGETHRQFDACSFWMAFFSGPSHMFEAAAAGRCEEDAHYTQQYPGAPYTARACPSEQPVRAEGKPLPALPGADETSEPPAPKGDKHPDPQDLYSHPRRLQMPRPEEPQSDTMEMRPTDWKPYSLDPGVY